jgi:tetratricopeptide (TPR) repeat protein
MKRLSLSPWMSLGVLAFILQAAPVMAATGSDFDAELHAIAQAWDHANFDVSNAREKAALLDELSARAASFASSHPQRAEPLIWEGIILSSYAGAKGGLGALSLAKRSRERLQLALKVAPDALNGSAYLSLGVLYYKVPGFPLGFGNHARAREYLLKALELNPSGIDPNYFYGEFLFEEGEYEQALQYLQKADAAPARADRRIADSGRHREIAALMGRAREKLG